MTRRPFWRGDGPRRNETGTGARERDFGIVEADREAARNRPAAEGLHWIKMDLHIHTPASSDYRDPGITYLDILKKAEEKGLELIAFADHNSVAGFSAMHREVETLTLLERLGRMSDQERQTLAEYKRLLDKITVLPAFEFTATFGFHILGVFPENTTVRKLEYLLLNLNVPEDRMVMGAPDVGSTSDVLAAYAAITQAGGLAIAAHANSSNGVAMQGFPFGGQTKIAYTQDTNLVALEVTDLESTGRRTTAAFYNGTKTEYPRRMHCIQGSDAHSLETEQSDSNNKRLGVGGRVSEILARDASFASLKEVLTSTDFTRTRPHRANWLWDLVEAARTQGPNIAQSFHERTITHTSRTRPILHDVAAFANTSGGTIYVGANADRRVPMHGVDRAEEDVRILKEDIRATIEPPIDVEFDVRPNGQRALIVLSVPKGDKAPYIFSPTGQIYVRVRADTHVANRQEIIDLVLSAHVPGHRVEAPKPGAARLTPMTQPETPDLREPFSPPERPTPSAAVPAPSTGAGRFSRGTRERPAEQRPERIGAAGGADRMQPTQQQQREEVRPAQPPPTPRPEPQPQPPVERPRPAWMANLPPEKLKGQVQPMVKPDEAPAQVEEQPSAEDAATSMEAAPAQEETQPEATPRPRRGRTRKSATEKSAVETPSGAPMEATVSAEHQTREEIVAEAAAEKPARGRRRRKADIELQVEAPAAASAETDAGQEAILIEAAVEPGAQLPAELPSPDADEAGKKPRSRRRTTAAQKAAPAETTAQSPPPDEETTPPTKAKGKTTQDEGRKTTRGRSKAVQTDEPAAQPEEKPKTRRGTRKKATDSGDEASSDSTQHPTDPPATGVEIIDETERGGNHYHTMRDLRNGQTVHNVTRQSARRLWLYAVQQHRRGAPEISEVFWHPELRVGVWRRESRAGALRYDLVSQYPDGSVRIFYGVTPDGLRGPWEEVVRLAEEAGYEGPEPAE